TTSKTPMKEQKVATKEIIRIEKMDRFIGSRRERVRNLKSLKQAFAVVLPERRYKPENIRPVRKMSISSQESTTLRRVHLSGRFSRLELVIRPRFSSGQTFQTAAPDRLLRWLRPSTQCPAFERLPLPRHESHAAVAAKLDGQNLRRLSREQRPPAGSLRKARPHRSPSTRPRLPCNAYHHPVTLLSLLRGIRWSEANEGTCSSCLVRFATPAVEEATQRRDRKSTRLNSSH